MHFDLGRHSSDVDYELVSSNWGIKHDLAHADDYVKTIDACTTLLTAPGTSQIVPEPLGVVGVISAWNYPVLLLVAPTAQAIIAGNCVIAKPSELSPKTSAVMKKLYDEYLDQRFYRCVEGRE